MHHIAVIILNYNTWEDTLNEVDLVQNVCNVPASDIIVVDNASPNESGIRLKENSKKKGFVFLSAPKTNVKINLKLLKLCLTILS